MVFALYLQLGHGLDPLQAGLVFTVLAVAYLVASLRAPSLTPRYGRDLIGVGALSLVVGDAALFVSVVSYGGATPTLVPGLLLVGAGMGLCITPLTSIVLSHADGRSAGSLSGTLATAQQVGNALGVAVTGVVFFGSLHGGYGHAFAVSLLELGSLLLGVALCTRLLPRRPAPTAGRCRGRGGPGGDRLDPPAGGGSRLMSMAVLVPIGDFSRMTHLSVKALRHYHDVGILEPARVDPSSGYRYYEPAQVSTAQVILRFRSLGMPLEDLKSVLDAGDVETRNQVIVAHLQRMEAQLEETQAMVASLRSILERPVATVSVKYRSVPETPALAVVERVTVEDLMGWWPGAFGELYETLEAWRDHARRPLRRALPERPLPARGG